MLLGPMLESFANRETTAKTRTRLLLAAMEVFAEHGVEGASLRRINELADCRNSSAVHYHFGGRDKLAGAVLEFIGNQWDMGLKAAPESESTDALLQLAGQSLLQLRNTDPWGRHAIRFMQRLTIERDPKMQLLWRIYFGKHLEPLAEALSRDNPQLSPDILRLRLVLIVGSLIHSIASLDAFHRTALGDVRQTRTEAQIVAEIVSYAAAGLTAPQAEAA
ncbi:TetR family transcriptional regulator [Pedomonas sp. V897]|uniref:TetR family transcriptional regulator n=1 Tax=Pedomonas sp. V897 TaxID=3446482 RepID=UPI003EE40E2E